MTFSRDQWIRLLLFTAIIMLTIANAAFAQGLTGGGGGGAGLLQPVWTWVTTNILPVIIIAAVVGLGVALLAMSFSLRHVLSTCIGVAIIAYAVTISGLMPVGN